MLDLGLLFFDRLTKTYILNYNKKKKHMVLKLNHNFGCNRKLHAEIIMKEGGVGSRSV